MFRRNPWLFGAVLILVGLGVAGLAASRLLRLTQPSVICPVDESVALVTDGEWSDGIPLINGRSEVKAAIVDGKIYVVGGLIAGNNPSPLMEVFDPGKNEWVEGTPLPVALHHMGVAAAGGKLYVTGGYDDATWKADVKDAWVYDPATNQWSGIEAMPGTRAAHEMMSIDDKLYLIGGDSTDDPTALWVYDTAVGTWDTSRAPLPTPREHLAAVVYEGRIYAVGGRWPVFGTNLKTVEVYDPATNTWTQGADMLTARSGFSAAVLNGHIHTAGGENLADLCTYPQHEVYDIEKQAWYGAEKIPVSRHGFASAVLDNRWYTIAGATQTGNGTQSSYTDVVEVFSETP